jgi:hypothetical protein
MFKAIAIASLLFLTQSLKLDTHDAIVYDKNGNMAYETNAVKTDTTYAGPGSVALADCRGKNSGDGCKLGGTCLVCGGVMQCRYWGKC